MDTHLREILLFKLFRAEAAAGTVATPTIVIAFNVIKYNCTHLKADANPRKAVNEQRPEGVSEYVERLNAAVEADRKKHKKKPQPGIKKRPESEAAVKNIKVSTTDPESGFMYRGNKPKGFFYLDHRTMDGKHGIITDTFVTPGNVHDSQPYIAPPEAADGALRPGHRGSWQQPYCRCHLRLPGGSLIKAVGGSPG